MQCFLTEGQGLSYKVGFILLNKNGFKIKCPQLHDMSDLDEKLGVFF